MTARDQARFSRPNISHTVLQLEKLDLNLVYNNDVIPVLERSCNLGVNRPAFVSLLPSLFACNKPCVVLLFDCCWIW